jgi:hypothetical protein
MKSRNLLFAVFVVFSVFFLFVIVSNRIRVKKIMYGTRPFQEIWKDNGSATYRIMIEMIKKWGFGFLDCLFDSFV